jgi:hypothetical protein
MEQCVFKLANHNEQYNTAIGHICHKRKKLDFVAVPDAKAKRSVKIYDTIIGYLYINFLYLVEWWIRPMVKRLKYK